MRGRYDWLNLAGGPRVRPLGDGRGVRLLPWAEVLEAKREAVELAEEGFQEALCGNACLVARCLVENGRPVHESGREVLESLAPEVIEEVARCWAAFDREVNPGLGAGPERVEELKAALGEMDQERLRWKVLRAFGALPTEKRAREMTGRELLWCALHLLLDEEEEMGRLCVSCRAEAEKEVCPVCGRETGEVSSGCDPGFDLERFEAMKGGRL